MNNYFPHDSNARGDERIISLRMKHGWQGYGLYWALIEKLRDSTCYKLATDYNVIAYDLRVDASIIKSIIEDFGLFSFAENGECFYSESLLKRMEIKDDKSEKARQSANKRWSKEQSQNDGNANAMRTHSDGNAIKVKESKENNNIETKEISSKDDTKKTAPDVAARKQDFYKSLVSFADEYPKEMLRAFFDYWTELNKSGKKMRFEMEKTWETGKRLSTWASRERVPLKIVSQPPKLSKMQQMIQNAQELMLPEDE